MTNLIERTRDRTTKNIEKFLHKDLYGKYLIAMNDFVWKKDRLNST